jgi:hypothetical protein
VFEYKRAIQAHLRPRAATLGQAALAKRLGFKSQSFLSAVLSDKDPFVVLPISCLPALVTLCELSAEEGLQLLMLRVNDASLTAYARHAKPRIGLDEATLRWIISSANATSGRSTKVENCFANVK